MGRLLWKVCNNGGWTLFNLEYCMTSPLHSTQYIFQVFSIHAFNVGLFLNRNNFSLLLETILKTLPLDIKKKKSLKVIQGFTESYNNDVFVLGLDIVWSTRQIIMKFMLPRRGSLLIIYLHPLSAEGMTLTVNSGKQLPWLCPKV